MAGMHETLLHEDAQWIIPVIAERSTSDIAALSIEGECLGLIRTRFEHDDGAPQFPRLPFKQPEKMTGNTCPSGGGAHIHAFQFAVGGPENDRATNEAPSSMASAHVSIGGRSLMTPVFSFEPRSAVGENCPLVRP